MAFAPTIDEWGGPNRPPDMKPNLRKKEGSHDVPRVDPKDYYCRERTWGAFHRTIPLPCEVEIGKVDATFKNGVLTVKLTKTPAEVEGHKRIEIKTE